MKTYTSLHATKKPVLEAAGNAGYTRIDIKDSDDDYPVALYVRDLPFEIVYMACEAFNAVLDGKTEGYLSPPSAPDLPAQAAE